MRLLYLYIKDYGCLKNCEFNFDSNYRFNFDRDIEGNYVLHCKENDLFPKNFFSAGISPQSPVKSISAIIGKNGMGKTTLARALVQLSENSNHMFEHIIVYEVEENNTQKIYCQHHLVKKLTNDMLKKYLSKNKKNLSHRVNNILRDYIQGNKKLENISSDDPAYQEAYRLIIWENIEKKIADVYFDLKLDPNCANIAIESWETYNNIENKFGFLYYSPHYTTEHFFPWGTFSDISTTKCLTIGAGSRSEYYQNSSYHTMVSPIQAHKAYEYKWALKLFSALKEKNHTLDEFFFKVPRGLQIFPENTLLDLSLTEIRKLRDEHKNDVSNDSTQNNTASTANLFELCDKISQLVTKRRTDDFFVTAFICYFVSYCRDHLNSIQGIAPSVIRKKTLENIQSHCSFLEELVDEMPSKQTCKTMDAIYKKILSFLYKNYPTVHSLFNLLYELYTFCTEEVISILTHVYCPCFEARWFDWALRFIDSYYQCFSVTNFLKFDFFQPLSSGEMSFISMFARVYEKLQVNKNTSASLPENILFFLDEAETTLHPALQLKLVDLNIKFWEIFAPGKKVHLIFASHSPMLLSDIPIENVSFLDNKSTPTLPPKAFGSNIFDLYRNSFFLSDGTIGVFANQKIQTLLNVVNTDISCNRSDNFVLELRQNRDKFNYFAKMIGDPIIREYLLRKYAECCCKTKSDKIEQYEVIIRTLKTEEPNNA